MSLFYIFFNFFVWNIGINILLLSKSISSQNYPMDTKNIKWCAEKKHTVDYIGPICIPDEKDEWTKESLDNCRGAFKKECPEFNEAECLWFPYMSSDPAQNEKLGNIPMQLPSCRLKYYAAGGEWSKYTWMEVHYTNQYGTWDSEKSVYDIVEINRKIKNNEAFDFNDQGDWPESVLDGNGERGLTWKDVTTPVNLKLNEICGKSDQAPIFKTIVDFLSSNFKDGFDSKQLPPKSKMETHYNAVLSYEYTPVCSVALIGGFKTNVCKVTYNRRSVYSIPETSSDVGATYNGTRKFVEAQVYIDRTKKIPRIRYAYLSYLMPL